MKKLVTAVCILALCHGVDAAPIRQTLNLEVASHVEGGMLDSLDRTVRFEITLTNLQSTPAEAELTLKFNTVAIKTGLGDKSHTINLGPKEKKLLNSPTTMMNRGSLNSRPKRLSRPRVKR